jgi:lactoylglutathione lyase
MTMKLAYAIHYVADMDRAVKFYRDTLGLPLKFASAEWTEFATGPTTLALHLASKENPAGTTHLGLHADDVAGAHGALKGKGVRFTRQPEPLHGITLAEFVDSEGARVSLSG